MRTWTKPILVKDTMELSQYSIAACDVIGYDMTISCRADNNGAAQHHADRDFIVRTEIYIEASERPDYENLSKTELIGLLIDAGVHYSGYNSGKHHTSTSFSPVLSTS